MSAPKEWCIRDEATGHWYMCACNWSVNPEDAARFTTYADAAGHISAPIRQGARIVEAPARPMTDDEAWTWLKEHNRHAGVGYLAVTTLNDATRAGKGAYFTRDPEPTPCDAIRAARRKVEKKT